MRRSSVVLMSTILGLLLGSCSNSHGPLERRSRIEINPQSVDLGEIDTSQNSYSGVMHVKNTGTADLQIHHIEFSCNCLDARLSKTQISPGTSTKLNYFLKLDQKTGFRRVALTIRSNAIDQPNVPILLSWKQIGAITMTEENIDLGNVAPNLNHRFEAIVWVREPATAPPNIKLGRAPHVQIDTVNGDPTSSILSPPLGSRRFRPFVLAGHVAVNSIPGHFEETLVIERGNNPFEFVECPIRWHVHTRAHSVPTGVYLGNTKAEVLKRGVSIFSEEEISKIDCMPTTKSIRTMTESPPQPAESNHRRSLRIEVDLRKLDPGAVFRGEIVCDVRFRNGGCERLTIPVWAIVSKALVKEPKDGSAKRVHAH